MVFLRGPVLLNLQEGTGLGNQDAFPKGKQLPLLNGEEVRCPPPTPSVGVGVVAKRNNSRRNNNQTAIRRWSSLELNHWTEKV